MKRYWRMAVILALLIILAGGNVYAEGSEYDYTYKSGTDSQLDAELFPDLKYSDQTEYTETLTFSVPELESDKVCLFLTAETENSDTEWPEHAGTELGIYERLFIVREKIFNPDLGLKEREQLNQELAELYQAAYHPESADLYDNEYTLLLKRLTCTVAVREKETVCPLTKHTVLGYFEKGENCRIKITISVPEDLRQEEKELLKIIRWNLTAEEYNSSPKLTSGLVLLNEPENGEYFTPGETVKAGVWYNNEGDIDLSYLVVRLMKEENNRGRKELDHDVCLMKEYNKRGIEISRTRNGFQTEYRITSADALNGGVRLWTEAEASCVSPEYPERMISETGLFVPAGETTAKEETESSRQTDSTGLPTAENTGECLERSEWLFIWIGLVAVSAGALVMILRRKKK